MKQVLLDLEGSDAGRGKAYRAESLAGHFAADAAGCRQSRLGPQKTCPISRAMQHRRDTHRAVASARRSLSVDRLL